MFGPPGSNRGLFGAILYAVLDALDALDGLLERWPAPSRRYSERPWSCPDCGARVTRGRFCRACQRYATTLDDPGSTQIIVLAGWLPAAVVAAIAGVVVAVATGNLLALLVVLVCGLLLGWLATVALFLVVLEYHDRRGLSEPLGEFLLLVDILLVGPVVGCAIAVTVLLW